MIRILAYLVAHFGKSLLWTGSDLLSVFVLVRLHGMAPGLAGWLFFAGLMLNALADGAVGRVLTARPQSRVGLALGGLVLAAIAFPASMGLGLNSATGAGMALTMVATLVFRVAYAAYDVPHNALMGDLARVAPFPGLLARGRTMGTALAALVLGLGLDLDPGARHLPLLLIGVALVAGMLAAVAIPLLRNMGDAPPLPEAREGVGLPWRFLAGTLLLVVGTGALSKGLLHLPADRTSPAVGSIVMLLTLGRLACTFYPLPLRHGRQGLVDLAAVHAMAGLVVMAFLWGNHAIMILLLGVAMGVANLMAWMLLPWLARHAGDYGVYTMASKLALGLSGLVMSAMLRGRSGFDSVGFAALVWGVAMACIAAGALLFPQLSLSPRSSGRPNRL